VRGVVAYARRQVGVPYRYGGSSRRVGFDCSGLVYASYRSIGKAIPRSSWDQLQVGRPVRFAALRPGDLVFTEGGRVVRTGRGAGGWSWRGASRRV
jgi:cell wall-associated NlpC family hydrolase